MNLSVVLSVLIVAVSSAKPSDMHLDIVDDPNNDGNSTADVFRLVSPSENYVLGHKHQTEISDISSEELRMNLSVVLCVLIVAICSAKPSDMHLDIVDDPNNDGNSTAGYPASTRQKRAFSILRAVLRTLLKGAKYVETVGDQSSRVKFYTKPGGYERALKDFYAVRPVNVEKNPELLFGHNLIIGQVDGGYITLVRSDPHPTIFFNANGAAKRHEIEYTPARH